MAYIKLIDAMLVLSDGKNSFSEITQQMEKYIENLSKTAFIEIVEDIGTIPEQINASSTEEKLYSKISDVVLARCFVELGIKAKAVTERGNSADVIGESRHGYTLVADAKTFRLSRTAKNQKDFKISTLSKWRGKEHDYAILVAPYFQYPNTNSQIYSSALADKVCLLSWEHLLFLLNHNISESEVMSLEPIWNAPQRIERESKIAFADRMNCLFPFINKMVCNRIGLDGEAFDLQLSSCKHNIIVRSSKEILDLKGEINYMMTLSRDEAISELLNARKLNERINAIEKYAKLLEVN